MGRLSRFTIGLSCFIQRFVRLRNLLDAFPDSILQMTSSSLLTRTPLGLWLQWASGQIRFGFEASKAIIFDVLPDSEDKAMVQSDYPGQVLVPFVGFTGLLQQVNAFVALDERCLEGANFRKLPQMEDDWSHVTVKMNQLHWRQPLNDQSSFEAAAKLVNEEESSKTTSGLLGLFLRFSDEGQTVFVGMPMNYDSMKNYSFIYMPELNTNETEEENSTLTIDSQDIQVLWEEGSNLDYNVTVSQV